MQKFGDNFLRTLGALLSAICIAFLCACTSSNNKPSFDELPRPVKTDEQSFTRQSQKLKYIIDRQELLAKKIAKNEMTETQAKAELDELEDLWNEYILLHQDDTISLILFGKFLRSNEDLDNAYKIFQKVDSLDSKLAVVKQQLAVREAEIGEFEKSYKHIKEAIELAPNEFLYHYQLAEFLRKVGNKICVQKILTREEKDSQMISSYKKALELNDEKSLRLQYANAFFDVQNPDLVEAEKAWDNAILALALPLEKDSARLNKAKIQIAANALENALATLSEIKSPAHIEQRDKLVEIVKSKLNKN